MAHLLSCALCDPPAPYGTCPEPLPTPLKLQSSDRNLFNKIMEGIIDTTTKKKIVLIRCLRSRYRRPAVHPHGGPGVPRVVPRSRRQGVARHTRHTRRALGTRDTLDAGPLARGTLDALHAAAATHIASPHAKAAQATPHE